MSQPKTKTPPVQRALFLPFNDDLEYAQEELRWVQARSERMALEHEMREADKEQFHGHRRHRFNVDEDSPKRLSQQRDKWLAKEQTLRAAWRLVMGLASAFAWAIIS